MVCGVGDLRFDHRPGRSDSSTVHSQPTEPWPAGRNTRGRRTDTVVALYVAPRAAGVCAAATAVSGGLALHRRRLCRRGRGGEEDLLPACPLLTRVDLVYFVYLVDLVHLVNQINEIDQTNQITV